MRNLEAEAKKVVATKRITAVKEKSKTSHCDIRKDTFRASLKLADLTLCKFKNVQGW